MTENQDWLPEILSQFGETISIRDKIPYTKVIAGLSLSIIAALIATSLVGIEGYLTAVYATRNPYNDYYYYDYYYYYYYINFTTVAILHGAIAFTSFCELIIAITYSVYCCKAGCGSVFEQNPTQYLIHGNDQPTAMTQYNSSHPPAAMYQPDQQFRNPYHEIPMTNYSAFLSQTQGQQQLGAIGYMNDGRERVAFPFRHPGQQQVSDVGHPQNAGENSAFPFRKPEQRGRDESTYSPYSLFSYAHRFSVPDRRHVDTQTTSADIQL